MKLCPRTGALCQSTGGCLNGCMFQGTPTYTAPNMGWQCPKCGRGNAPFVHQCPCGPAYITWASAGVAGGLVMTGAPCSDCLDKEDCEKNRKCAFEVRT